MGAALALSLAVACGEEERPPPFSLDSSGEGGLANLGGAAQVGTGGRTDVSPDCEGPPTPETMDLCGEQVVPVVVNRPTLYFVLDVSGSMFEPLPADDAGSSQGDPLTKLEASQAAILSLTLEHGHRIRYGLATFPGPDTGASSLLGCGAGQEVFTAREGDPLLCLNRPGGEVQNAFATTVRSLSVGGGTPLSATLQVLESTITALPQPAFVVLLTDGAPNCNEEATCEASACIPNLEGGALPSGRCTDSFNCCDSDEVSAEDLPYIGVPEAMCVDGDASLEAIETFAAAGVRTFVVGVPGSDAYRGLMNAFAEAGGTARDGEVAYFDVRKVGDLSDALAAIGAETSQSCTVSLEEQSSRPDLLNVYFDAELVHQGGVNGWSSSGDELTFHGAACDQIAAGRVTQIHLISGCPTVY